MWTSLAQGLAWNTLDHIVVECEVEPQVLSFTSAQKSLFHKMSMTIFLFSSPSSLKYFLFLFWTASAWKGCHARCIRFIVVNQESIQFVFRAEIMHP